jgi:hypothetical protein
MNITDSDISHRPADKAGSFCTWQQLEGLAVSFRAVYVLAVPGRDTDCGCGFGRETGSRSRSVH